MICYMDKMESAIGTIHLAAIDHALVYCANPRENGFEMESWLKKYLPEYVLVKEGNKILEEAKTQLKEYFHGKRREFSIPLELLGTDFRKKVWQALTTIPYGESRTYGEIAKQVGNPKGPRAIGQANHHNPISYIVP